MVIKIEFSAAYLGHCKYFFYLIEASRGAGAQSVTEKPVADSIPTRGNEIFI